jgi:hypothetical protein
MFKKASSPRAKGKERAGSVDEKSGLTKKLRQRTPAEKEARKNGPYVADFDRKQTFDLDIDPKVKRPFNSGLTQSLTTRVCPLPRASPLG